MSDDNTTLRPSGFDKRLQIVAIFLMLFFLALLARVAYLTFWNSHDLSHTFPDKILRGAIYDRKGIELAISRESSTIGINPGNIYDPRFTAEQLEPYLNISAEKIERLIIEKKRYFLLKREISNEVANEIMKMSLPGVRRDTELKRIYPQGKLASNLLGFTGLDDDRALSGLEYFYHNELMTPSDPGGRRGNNIHLTIDGLIQYKMESILEEEFHKSESKKAIGILMDVQSGRVLAMANFPNFDPNHYADFPDVARTNWAIRHIYEPGSTMKIFMAAAIWNENLVSDRDRFYCPGFISIPKGQISCSSTHGNLSLEEILEHSCNVGIIKSSYKIPNGVLYDYLKRFRFGEKSGILENENVGYLPPLTKWTEDGRAYMAIGQGISVTPIQLVAAAAALANGGKFITPSVVSHLTDSYGKIIQEIEPKSTDLKLKESTKRKILQAMEKVVESGTGRAAFANEFSLAGKTGTGQKALPGEGYVEGLWSSSFLGFYPAKDPKIVGLILFDEPKGDKYSGGSLAAPVFKRVIQSILPVVDRGSDPVKYELIRVDRNTDMDSASLEKLPDLKGKSKREVLEIISNLGISFKIHGNGFLKTQEPQPGTELQKIRTLDLYFSETL